MTRDRIVQREPITTVPADQSLLYIISQPEKRGGTWYKHSRTRVKDGSNVQYMFNVDNSCEGALTCHCLRENRTFAGTKVV